MPGETNETSVAEVRRRVRGLPLEALVLVAGGTANLTIDGSAPPEAVARLEAMREEALAELERRGGTLDTTAAPVGSATCRGPVARERTQA